MNTELLLSKKPTQLDYPTLYGELKSILGYAYQYCGQTPSGEDKEEQRQEIEAQLSMLITDLQHFRSLTLQEIRLAFENGLRGEYKRFGEFSKLNNRTYSFWLSCFLEDKKSKPFKVDETKLLAKPETPDDETLKKIRIAAFNISYDIFKRTGEIHDVGNSVYNLLWRIGEIRFDKEQWEKYKAEAEQIEYSRLSNERSFAQNRMDRITVNKIDLELDMLTNGDNNIEIVARKLALRDYFLLLNPDPQSYTDQEN